MATASPTNETSPSASANGQLRSSPVPEFERPDHAPALEHRREIVERKNRDDARQRAGGAGIDAPDQRMRMRAAREGRRKHAGRGDVVNETALAGQQRAVLEARDPRTDRCAHGLLA